MKILFLLLPAVLFAMTPKATGQAASREPAGPFSGGDLAEIERLEEAWNVANEISDADAKLMMLADESYHVGPSGRVYNKSQDIAATVAARRQKDASTSTLRFLITGKLIRMFKDVSVVTATGISVTTQDGTIRIGSRFRSIHVWEKQGTRWRLIVDQVTGAGPGLPLLPEEKRLLEPPATR
jgi:ketosteroid isomerase-like protein